MSTNEMDISELEGGLYADQGYRVLICAAFTAFLCTLFICLRFLAHHVGKRPIFLEDWLMIPAWVLMMGLCANVICTVKLGAVGRHEAYVLQYEPQAMVAWAKTLFVVEFFYGFIFPIEKTSILLLYLRIFHVHRWFRYSTYALIVYIWMWGICETLLACLQCTPMAYQWDKTLDGHCIDQLAYYRYISVPNIIHDLLMLFLPAPAIWQLQMDARRKVALGCVFMIASLGCIASFVRLSIFFELDALSDNTWKSVQLMSWTLAEPGVIFICACMPALWPFLRYIPQIRKLTKKSSSGTDGSDGARSNTPVGENAWTRYSRNLVPGSDKFTPLSDVEAGSTTWSITAGAGARGKEAGWKSQPVRHISGSDKFIPLSDIDAPIHSTWGADMFTKSRDGQ